MKQRVLIVRLDAIGDYILFRNVLRFIRNSKKYKDAEFTLFGNPAWRQLAEVYDSDCADHWVWATNREELFRKPIENLLPECIWHKRVSKAQMVWRAKFHGKFDVVLSLQAFRDPLLDELVAHLAPETVNGWELPQGDSPFVFCRNCAIASVVTGEQCNIPFELKLENRPPQTNNILFFTGASHWTRRWPMRNWRKLEDLLPEGYIAKYSPMNGTLPDFLRMVASCAAVVTNDTMASHAAAALNVPCVTITNGVSGKDGFWPYPLAMHKTCRAIMPENKMSSKIIPRIIRERLEQFEALCSIKANYVSKALADTTAKGSNEWQHQ